MPAIGSRTNPHEAFFRKLFFPSVSTGTSSPLALLSSYSAFFFNSSYSFSSLIISLIAHSITVKLNFPAL
jgi:hypothetical protein